MSSVFYAYERKSQVGIEVSELFFDFLSWEKKLKCALYTIKFDTYFNLQQLPV